MADIQFENVTAPGDAFHWGDEIDIVPSGFPNGKNNLFIKSYDQNQMDPDLCWAVGAVFKNNERTRVKIGTDGTGESPFAPIDATAFIHCNAYAGKIDDSVEAGNHLEALAPR